MLPPVVDIEFYGNKYKNVPDIKQTQKQLQIMLEKLEEYYEKKPIIYATYKSYNLYIANNFEGNYIWIRDVYFKPNLKDNRGWTFWQYSNKVRLNGYSGQEKRIDMNVFNGDSGPIIIQIYEEKVRNENNYIMWKFEIQKRNDGNCRENGVRWKLCSYTSLSCIRKL